ncbi:MAG TPA: hypothetical protein VFP49_13725 [Nitrososphaeraceae archaeon]|nr:hypothetical protein [Nitrososphaeraceae archaeon]
MHFQTFIVSIIIEIMFVFAIIKVYDELGCKWESIKTIPLISKKKEKEFQSTVQNNYYYNSNNNTVNSKTRICPNCGISITNYKINSRIEGIPKFCRNCGFLVKENIIDINQQQRQQKKWSFYN